MARINFNDIEEISRSATSGLFHCTRVWDAWQVGTMTQDDFVDAHDSETPSELTQMIVDLLESSGIEVFGK
jgi:hypothetical protein